MKREPIQPQPNSVKTARRPILPIVMAVLCAGLIIAARFLPPGTDCVLGGIAFAYTDALILIAAQIEANGLAIP